MFQSYLKIALRNLRSQRSYTLLNIIGLSVGMAGGLLIFLFLRHHVSTDRYHAHVDRIVRFSTDLHLDDGSIEYNAEGPPPLARLLRTRYPQVEQAAFLLGMRAINVGIRRPNQMQTIRFLEHEGIGFVEPEWLDVLTYTWLQGNPQTALQAPNHAVLTESWAIRYFGTTAAIGQTLTLNNKAVVTVTGVVADPPGPTDTRLGLLISFPTVHQLGVGAGLDNDWSTLNSSNRVYARLKSPSSIVALQQVMPALSKQQYGESAHIYQFVIQPLTDIHFDVARDPAHAVPVNLLWSLGVVGLLLVVTACINFINLATAQTLRRGKEVGVRKTLGSSRGQLVGQFFLETGLIAIAATALAVVLSYGSLPLFNRWIQLNLVLRFDGLTIGFILLLLLSVVGLAGLYPALVLSGISPWAALRGRLVHSVNGLRVRQALIVTQFAVCQVLILAALVVVNQIRYMQRADLGFKKDNILVVNLPFDQKSRHDAFKQKLLAYAPIRSVSLSVLPPSSQLGYGGSFKFEGKAEWEKYPVVDRLADADYVRTYGLQLLAGRTITPGDTIRDYVINETLMHKLGFTRPEQVVGRRLQYYLSTSPLPIVGVIRDFHQKSLRHEISPALLASWAPWYRQAGIRIAGATLEQSLSTIRTIWQEVFPDEVFEYQFFDEQVARLYETETMVTRLINIFAALAILLCCLGLYGLVLHRVGQRTKEIGIRKVLGASIASIVALLSTEFLTLVAVAIVIASPLAWWVMTKWLQDFAYKTDIAWWVFVLAGVLAVSIALLTVSFQSVKAALANPAKSLRAE